MKQLALCTFLLLWMSGTGVLLVKMAYGMVLQERKLQFLVQFQFYEIDNGSYYLSFFFALCICTLHGFQFTVTDAVFHLCLSVMTLEITYFPEFVQPVQPS